MRRAIVLTVVVAVGVIGWLILDADPRGRAELWDRVTGWFDGEDARAPNWGDVATKVGEFTEEERGLRETLNPAEVAPVPEPAPPTP